MPRTTSIVYARGMANCGGFQMVDISPYMGGFPFGTEGKGPSLSPPALDSGAERIRVKKD